MRTTTEMKLVPIDRLVPYINNARTHSPEQINKLRSSLREFGFINPVIIDRDYGVIAGHGRILAAKEEGITEVPCVFADYLTEAQKKAYIIADNRMAMDAGWDEELLRVEIEALQAEAFDVSLTGFDPNEIDDLFKENLKDGLHDDDFDIEAMMDAEALQKERVGELHALLMKEVPEARVLAAGTCTLCKKCSFPDEPCRFPDQAMVSMEAAGLVVSDTCTAAGIPYNHGKLTLAYSSCVLV